MENHRLRVLLIEDDEDDYILVRDMLAEIESPKIRLDWVARYDGGLRAICDSAYDAYLLDYQLGEGTGLDLLREAASSGCTAPIILLTGHGDYDVDMEAMKAGASDYLVKGQINPYLLERSIRYAIERKRAEDELRKARDELELRVVERTAELIESEERYKVLVESSQDVIYTVSPEGVITSLNPAFETTTGWLARDWVGGNYDGLIHPEYIGTIRERIRRVLGGEAIPPAEIRIRCSSGQYRIMELKTVPQVLKGTVVGVVGTARDVTDRKCAEERIHDQNEFLNTILESLTHPFYVLDANDYTIRMANSSAGSKGLYTGATCHALIHASELPCTGPEHLCPLKMIKETKKPSTTEHIHYDDKGQPRNIEVHGYPIFDRRGEVAQIIEYSFDITDRKRMEEDLRRARQELEERVRERTAELARANEALQESEEKYRELVQNANSIILRMDAEGNITFFNEFAQSFFGWSEDEILGRNIVGTIVPAMESTGRDLKTLARDIAEHPDIYANNENENIRRNGERVWVVWTNKPFFDQHGRVESVLSVGSDITDRKRAEEALRLDEARLQALLDLSRLKETSVDQISAYVLEQQVKLTRSSVGWVGFVNDDESVLTLHVWSGADGRGLVQRAVELPAGQEGLWAEVVRCKRSVIVNDYGISPKQVHATEHVAMERFMSTVVLEGDRTVAVAAVANKDRDYDQSDLRQLTLLLDGMWRFIQRGKAEEALRESERLAAMGRALSSVAHDMKTPLIAIGGFTRMVQRRLDPNSGDFEKLEIVVKETCRLESMVKDMLDFSRPLDLDRTEEDTNRLVQECMELAGQLAQEKRVNLGCRLSEDLPPARIDGMRMKQVVLNLIVNAVQASPEGETVTVRTGHARGYLLIDIIDRGEGIPPNRREEIFHPFVTTKREGTGLGLPIVKKIVEAHMGRVHILDNPDKKGVTLRVSLPLSE
ncbi:MAG: PAS domain S-box protein [Acidobacteriota bacterium]